MTKIAALAVVILCGCSGSIPGDPRDEGFDGKQEVQDTSLAPTPDKAPTEAKRQTALLFEHPLPLPRPVVLPRTGGPVPR